MNSFYKFLYQTKEGCEKNDNPWKTYVIQVQKSFEHQLITHLLIFTHGQDQKS